MITGANNFIKFASLQAHLMIRFTILLTNLLLPLILLAQREDWLTDYEKSGYLDTPRYSQTIDYCRRLADASGMITYSAFGKSPEGLELPLLILDREGFSDPALIHASGRTLLLIEACIHAGECDGKDAGLMLFRDLAFGRKESNIKSPSSPPQLLSSRLLDNVSIIFIPIFNVDGHERFGAYNRINQNGPREMGWRVTSNNLNLNRDFLKADTPEMKAWLNLFNSWMPDFFIDAHTTDGADYQYVLTYLMEIYGDADEHLTAWAKDRFIPSMKDHMNSGGYPVFPYVDFRNWHDPRSGLITEVAPPMLSQGYTTLRNRPGLLIETHMLKPYKQRVDATYECFLTTLEILNRESVTLRNLVSKADQFVASEAFLKTPFPLRFETLMNDSAMVEFLGVAYTSDKSDLSGGMWFKYSKTPETFTLPYFYKTRPELTVNLPVAYIIPAQWTAVIEKLNLHGIKSRKIETDKLIKISTCHFKNPKWQSNPYEGRHPMIHIEFDEITEERWFPAGSVIIETMQPAGRIIPHLLEPNGNGSLLYWGFFDAIFEQKEYGESYVMESLAREMLATNPALKTEFEKKKAGDPGFMSNSWEVLNWFYNRSPYADPRMRIYPVGKIYDRTVLSKIFQ